MESDQRPHRSLICVEGIGPENVKLLVPSWSPDKIILRPSTSLSLPKGTRSGDYLLGDVNIGAVNEEQLFFKNLEPAPQTDNSFLA